MKTFKIILLTLLCGLLASCAKWGNTENNRLMQQALELAETMPDSALTLLDAVNTASFNRAQTAEYTLLRVQARTNAGMDLTTDAEIFQAWEYFVKKKNAEKAALAGFYASWVANAQKKPDLQMDVYLKSLPFAEKEKNMLLQGKFYQNMGYLNYSKQLFDDAINNYRKALKYYKAAGNQYQREALTLNNIANAYLMNQHTDSAQFYYQAALQLAQLHDDISQQATIYTNMGVSYSELGQLDTAMHYCRKALSIAQEDDEKALTFFNMADIFKKSNMPDSARYYLTRAEHLLHPVEDMYVQASVTHLHYQIEKVAENYQKALTFLENYTLYQDTLTDRRDRQLLLDMQRKYDTAAVVNEYQLKQNLLWKYMAILGFAVLALTGTVIYFSRENRKKDTTLKETEKDKMEQLLALEKMEREKMEQQMALDRMEREKEKMEKELETLQNLFSRRDNEMRNAVIDKLGIIKGITGLRQKVEVNKRLTHEKMKEAIDQFMACFTVGKIMATINEGYPGLVEELKSKYPKANLSEREICVCCLCLFGFDNNEIAFLIEKNKKTKAVENWKTAIRRQLGIDEYGDIQKALKGKITAYQK